MYDPSVGRWFSTDAFESFYTSVSPYSSVLNNPILNLDVNGLFVIQGTAAEQKLLRSIIDATKKALATNPFLLEKLKLHSGLTDKEINYLLTDGQGPVLQFKSLSPYGYAELQGAPNTSKMLAQDPNVNPQGWEIDVSIIFNNINLADDDNRFLIVMSILHEMVHIGDRRDGIRGNQLDYPKEEANGTLKKGFVTIAEQETKKAGYNPVQWAYGIEAGKGFEVDVASYSIQNDANLPTRRKNFEDKSNTYDKKQSKIKGQKPKPASRPRF